jgi:hypothetical protein
MLLVACGHASSPRDATILTGCVGVGVVAMPGADVTLDLGDVEGLVQNVSLPVGAVLAVVADDSCAPWRFPAAATVAPVLREISRHVARGMSSGPEPSIDVRYRAQRTGTVTIALSLSCSTGICTAKTPRSIVVNVYTPRPAASPAGPTGTGLITLNASHFSGTFPLTVQCATSATGNRSVMVRVIFQFTASGVEYQGGVGNAQPLTPGQTTTVPTRRHTILFEALDHPGVVYRTEDSSGGEITMSDRFGHSTPAKLYGYTPGGEPQDGTVAVAWNC